MNNPKLITAAAAVFAAYPEAQDVHVCEDGNVFLPERKQLAQAHCAANRLPAPVVVSRKLVETADKLKGNFASIGKAVSQSADRVLAERKAAEEKAGRATVEEAELDPEVLEAEGRGGEPKVEEEKKVVAEPAPKGKGKGKKK